MPVRYITVTPITKLFKPKTRSFGDVAIVGETDRKAIGPTKTPLPITNPDSISYASKTTLSAEIDAAPTTTTLPVTSILRLGIGPSGKHSRVSRATREPSPQRHDNSPWKRPRLIEIASQ